jgi:hypothetical protein
MELSNAALEWVNHGVVEETPWFNNHRLLELIGNIAPAEAEANFHAALERADLAAWLRQISPRQTWGRFRPPVARFMRASMILSGRGIEFMVRAESCQRLETPLTSKM